MLLTINGVEVDVEYLQVGVCGVGADAVFSSCDALARAIREEGGVFLSSTPLRVWEDGAVGRRVEFSAPLQRGIPQCAAVIY